MDTAMLMEAMKSEDSAALFLDFEAAFASINQGYIKDTLKWLGIPSRALNAFNFLYSQGKCRIAVKGESFMGFNMKAGVRQGCPLSPLVYVLVAEV